MHKEDIAKHGLKKSEQKVGSKFNIGRKKYMILHICKNKDYRVVIEVEN